MNYEKNYREILQKMYTLAYLRGTKNIRQSNNMYDYTSYLYDMNCNKKLNESKFKKTK